jgi:hypothetical protein
VGVQLRDTALRGISAIRIRDAGNVLRVVNSMRIRDAGNVLRNVFTSLALTVNNSEAAGTEWSTGGSAITVTSTPVTATPAGGTAPFTYAWVRVSGSAAITATAGTSATSAFAGSVNVEEIIEAAFECTATDANGATAKASVNVTLHHVSLS